MLIMENILFCNFSFTMNVPWDFLELCTHIQGKKVIKPFLKSLGGPILFDRNFLLPLKQFCNFQF